MPPSVDTVQRHQDNFPGAVAGFWRRACEYTVSIGVGLAAEAEFRNVPFEKFAMGKEGGFARDQARRAFSPFFRGRSLQGQAAKRLWKSVVPFMFSGKRADAAKVIANDLIHSEGVLETAQILDVLSRFGLRESRYVDESLDEALQRGADELITWVNKHSSAPPVWAVGPAVRNLAAFGAQQAASGHAVAATSMCAPLFDQVRAAVIA